MYNSGTGTRGRRHGDARLGTWGHQVWDGGTCGAGTRDFKHRDAGDAGTIMIIEKVGGKCDISHFPREYVLVKATHLPSLRFLHACLRSEDSAKIPCFEES